MIPRSANSQEIRRYTRDYFAALAERATAVEATERKDNSSETNQNFGADRIAVGTSHSSPSDHRGWPAPVTQWCHPQFYQDFAAQVSSESSFDSLPSCPPIIQVMETQAHLAVPMSISIRPSEADDSVRDVYEKWLMDMADVDPTRVEDIADGLIIVYTIEDLRCRIAHSYALSGIRVLQDFNRLRDELRSIILPSFSLRSRLAAFELSPKCEEDIKSLEPIIKASRHLRRKNPSNMYLETWRGCNIICFVDIIPEKSVADSIKLIPLEYRAGGADNDNEVMDMEMPDIVDPEELFDAIRAEHLDN
ncbi:hypothetical protein SCHPADRAFT_945709 [Schizopora paradoxa]|uniref:Uncharacterized protein n=1 Tax=Schizopora paradoxa TaxID=27342 RepID=A0A0H2RBQ0_9AGAM|nr:hypothetical protein SCHPADRAFT_945709 [Schizopora paradoxa]